MKIVGYCILGGKQYVMYEDKNCRAGWFKLTDGFHDRKLRWNSEEMIGICAVRKEDIDIKKIIRRMRGARPWHPLLTILRKEAVQ